MRIGILRIGALAERTGTTVATIRYYEQIGLLRPAARSGGQRTYDNEDVRRLSFIRRCRDLDFPVDDIRALLCTMASPAPRRESSPRNALSSCAAGALNCKRSK